MFSWPLSYDSLIFFEWMCSTPAILSFYSQAAIASAADLSSRGLESVAPRP